MFERMFGFFRKEKPTISPSPVTPIVDGSAVIATGNMAGYYGFTFDLDTILRNELQMVNYYREVSTYPDCDTAIEQIVNEAVIVDEAKPPVSINLENLPKEYTKLKKTLQNEFDYILSLYSFNENCHDLFKRWYIDGRLYYFVMIDPKTPKKGILDVKYIDPRKIKKITAVNKEKDENGIDIVKDVEEYYLFNDEGLLNTTQGIKLSPDSIVDVKSGLVDANTGEVISHLFKAIKPVNQLKMMEDALVIYRITRAPERRIFYVDTGNLPPQKAEQYVQNIMNRFRNKVVYDAKTGEVRNNRNYISMMEDFWLPRREGGKATEIVTLPGCLAMDTKVSLLDGRELSIRDISNEMANGKTLWTYSCHPITGEVVPGLITWAGVTQKSAQVMRITLDNGESIVCTPDHKFPIKGVGFVRADELTTDTKFIGHRDFNGGIKAIEWLDEPIEVGTLTIDGNEIYHDYHTFALACGVFTKNSQNLSEIADIEYFQNKLYQSMGVPRNRLAADNNFALGRPTEITREEILFSKFIQRLRNNFNDLFRNTLRIQLIAKNIIKESEWKRLNLHIHFDYQHDNYFEELKRQEIFNDRIAQLQNVDQFKGIYFSREWIVKNVLQYSDEEWKRVKAEMKEESENDDPTDDFGFTPSKPKDSDEPKDVDDSNDADDQKDPDAVESGEEANE